MNTSSRNRLQHRGGQRQASGLREVQGRPVGSSASIHAGASKATAKPREAVKGSRKLWGAHQSVTTAVVKTVLESTNITAVEGLSVKRKYKMAQVGRIKHEVQWWFVIKGDESVLEQLDESWKQLPATGSTVPPRWKLEPLMRYISEDTTRTDRAPSCNESATDNPDQSEHSPSTITPSQSQSFLELSPASPAKATQ